MVKTLEDLKRTTESLYKVLGNGSHVKRLSKLLRLTKETNPEKIEKDLMEIIPKGPEWRDFPLRLIEYGRVYCPARKHDHQNYLKSLLQLIQKSRMCVKFI